MYILKIVLDNSAELLRSKHFVVPMFKQLVIADNCAGQIVTFLNSLINELFLIHASISYSQLTRRKLFSYQPGITRVEIALPKYNNKSVM